MNYILVNKVRINLDQVITYKTTEDYVGSQVHKTLYQIKMETANDGVWTFSFDTEQERDNMMALIDVKTDIEMRIPPLPLK